jgi:hypothetical protein
MVFSEEILRLTNNASFLRIDHTDDSGKRILAFAGGDCEYLFRRRIVSPDGTFKSCPTQFGQLYCLRVDLGSTPHENYVHPVLLALLPDKKETTHHCLSTLLKSWCSFWSPKITKVDSEAAVMSVINKVLPAFVTPCRNFDFNQCLWRQIQNTGLTVEYEENEQVRLTRKVCSFGTPNYR